MCCGPWGCKQLAMTEQLNCFEKPLWGVFCTPAISIKYPPGVFRHNIRSECCVEQRGASTQHLTPLEICVFVMLEGKDELSNSPYLLTLLQHVMPQMPAVSLFPLVFKLWNCPW